MSSGFSPVPFILSSRVNFLASFFLSLFTKTTYQLLEDKDLARSLPIDVVYDILGLCVKRYNHGFGESFLLIFVFHLGL